MITWKLTIEYDGSRYSGWQEQKNARTLSGQIREIAEEVFHTAVELHGAGRTDAGVHALAQVAHMRMAASAMRNPAEIVRKFNRLLPSDISILRAEPVSNRFHARHDAVSRAYLYQIATRKSAFMKRHVWWVKERIELAPMLQAAGMLTGRHDFACFRAADPSRPNESTLVVVNSASVEEDDYLIRFRIEASHFLWRMVRRIAGVLVKLGTGEMEMRDFELLLSGHCEKRLDVAAWTAPASGLFLEHVEYRKTAQA